MAKLNQNTTNHTVLILAAGMGRRMGPFSRMVNKCLVPFGNKPLISHIFDKFPIETNFVVAVGNMSDQVKDYVRGIHSEKNITFVDIPEFDEHHTGPATTISYCSQYLPEKFFWISCDTLFDFDYTNKLDHNWIAVFPVDSIVSQDYCWITRNGNSVTGAFNKKKSDTAVDAFIGFMFVHDRKFVSNLIDVKAKDVYEGFVGLDLQAYTVQQWQDFGTYDKWKHYNENLPEISFPKPDEIFYDDNLKIIKFTTNANLAESKFHRAELNRKCCPQNVSYKGNFLFYDKEPGNTLYNCLTEETFTKFLSWANATLWISAKTLPNTALVSDKFYRKKTLERLAKFRVKYNSWAEFTKVNECEVKTLDEYVNDLDFNYLTSTTQWAYIHGDLQFDNIIYNKENDRFTIIDWRTDFGGDLYGDLYYDLAKILGGLYLSYKRVKADEFAYEEGSNYVLIDIPSVDNLNWYVDTLRKWVIDKNLDWCKVQSLVPIIYLNMAPLHEAPFDKFLVALAQYLFSQL